MKVVWICHFSNQEVQNILKPWKRINEFAPWISALAKMFEGRNEIELHIISPHEYISSFRFFKIRGIHYHFFNAHMPILGRHWPRFFKFDYWTDFFFTKIKVKKIVNRIEPDLIHLHGSENAYYSSSIFQFRSHYPILVTIQGFISHTTDKKNYQIKKRIQCEQKILKTFRYFGYRTKNMGKEIQKFNPQAELHWHHYPFSEVKSYNVKKKYDVVFFGRICRDKGIEDLLQAIALVKKNKPDISLLVIGRAHENYMKSLRSIATELKIEDCIEWAGFLPTQEDVHRIASQSRISVLPTYHEIISGTIIESMFLKLPVVAYNVGSIPEINDPPNQYVLLIKKGDIVSLSNCIKRLLDNTNRINELSKKSYYRAKSLFQNENIFCDLIKAYSLITKNGKL